MRMLCGRSFSRNPSPATAHIQIVASTQHCCFHFFALNNRMFSFINPSRACNYNAAANELLFLSLHGGFAYFMQSSIPVISPQPLKLSYTSFGIHFYYFLFFYTLLLFASRYSSLLYYSVLLSAIGSFHCFFFCSFSCSLFSLISTTRAIMNADVTLDVHAGSETLSFPSIFFSRLLITALRRCADRELTGGRLRRR